MTKERQSLRQSSHAVAMVILATAMAGFMLLLVLLNYSSAQRVRKALILQVERETEKRAMALEYFFSERRENLVEISRSRELNVYFENQALGMSMEYGLRQSLPPIREKLEYYLDSKRIGVESIFTRFVLIQSDGTLLIDTSRPQEAAATDSTYRSCLAPELRQGQVLIMDGGREIMVSLAHSFKGAYAGQILAWINGPSLFAHLLNDRDSRGGGWVYLLFEKGRLGEPIGWTESRDGPLPPAEILKNEGVFEFREAAGRDDYLAAQAPIGGTPFVLVQVAPTRDTLGQLKPWQFLIGMGLLAVILLAGAAYSIRLYLRSSILSVHLAEVVAREKVVSEKNKELEQEIAERTQAQESFTILRMGMEEVPLRDLLDKALAGLTDISWIGCRGECTLHLVEEMGDRLSVKASRGDARDCGPCAGTARPEEWGRWAQAYLEKAEFTRSDEPGHPGHCDVKGAHGHYWAPLIFGPEFVGVLSVITHHGHEQNENASRFLCAFTGILSFIIQRRRAEDELRLAHQANKTLIHSIPLVLITLDGEGRVVRFNPAAEKVLDRSADKVVGRKLVSCGMPWNFDSLPAMLAEAPASPCATAAVEVRFTRVDGGEGFLSVVVGAIADSGPDAAARILLVASDVTERRMLEAQLLLAQKLEAIGQLAAGIAHEINTPAQYLSDNLQFLRDVFVSFFGYVDKVQAVCRDELSTEHARRLTSAVESLDLEFARENVPRAFEEASEGIARITTIVSVDDLPEP